MWGGGQKNVHQPWPLALSTLSVRGRERVAGVAAKRTFTVPGPGPLVFHSWLFLLFTLFTRKDTTSRSSAFCPAGRPASPRRRCRCLAPRRRPSSGPTSWPTCRHARRSDVFGIMLCNVHTCAFFAVVALAPYFLMASCFEFICITIGTCVEASGECCNDCAADVGARPDGLCVSSAGASSSAAALLVHILAAGRPTCCVSSAGSCSRAATSSSRCAHGSNPADHSAHAHVLTAPCSIIGRISRRPPTSSPRRPRVRVRVSAGMCAWCVCVCGTEDCTHTQSCWTRSLACGRMCSLLDTSARFWKYVLAFGHEGRD